MNEFWKIASALEFKDYSFMPAGIAFLISIILLVVMKRKGLLTRKHRWYDAYVFFYYFYIPIVFFCAGCVWEATASLERTYQQAYNQSKGIIVSESVEATNNVGKSLGEAYKELSSIRQEDLTFDISNAFLDEYKNRLNRETLSSFMATIADSFQKDIADAISAQVNIIVAKHFVYGAVVSSEDLARIWKEDVESAIGNGLAGELAGQRVEVFYQPNFRFVKIMFLIFMLPVIIEEALWLFFTRGSRRKKAMVEEKGSDDSGE